MNDLSKVIELIKRQFQLNYEVELDGSTIRTKTVFNNLIKAQNFLDGWELSIRQKGFTRDFKVTAGYKSAKMDQPAELYKVFQEFKFGHDAVVKPINYGGQRTIPNKRRTKIL